MTFSGIEDLSTWTGGSLFNTDGNPLFRDIDNNDLVLKKDGCSLGLCDSPCVDEGDDNAISELHDIRGEDRTVDLESGGSIVDMAATRRRPTTDVSYPDDRGPGRAPGPTIFGDCWITVTVLQNRATPVRKRSFSGPHRRFCNSA